MARIATLDMTKDLAPRLTMTVNIIGIKKWHIRMQIAVKLIKLAAMIMNVGLKFEDKPYYGADL